MLKILCTSIALVACAAAAPAFAEEASTWRGTPWVYGVSYADLDLSQPTDRSILLARVQAVGEELCRDRLTINGRERCVRRVVEHAIARAPAPARLALQDSLGDAVERRLAQH